MNLVAQVIERQQPVKEHQPAIGKMQIVFGVIADLLQLANDIVGTETHRACSKRWQAGHHCRTMLLQKFLCSLENVPPPHFAFVLALGAFDCKLIATRVQLHVRPRSQKCIATDLFTTFY